MLDQTPKKQTVGKARAAEKTSQQPQESDGFLYRLFVDYYDRLFERDKESDSMFALFEHFASSVVWGREVAAEAVAVVSAIGKLSAALVRATGGPEFWLAKEAALTPQQRLRQLEGHLYGYCIAKRLAIQTDEGAAPVREHQS
jgi:hypothetical protein